MAGKLLAERKRRIIGSILHREEWEEHKQLQHLKTGELVTKICFCPIFAEALSYICIKHDAYG